MDVTSTGAQTMAASAAQTSAAASDSSGTGSAAAAGNKLISSDFQLFLKMLTTQIQNQDPLNPIESSDYAVQLATFSGVEQQVRTNELMTSLLGQLGVTSMGQYASWVGMEARTAAAVPFAGTPLTLYPSPAKDAAKTVLVAYNAEGREVMRQEIRVGRDPVQWTGQSPTGGQVMNGTYSFKLENYDAAGKELGVSAVQSYARVTEVRQGSTGPVLVLAGGAMVTPADVQALRPGPTG